jgi:hypothetical protein
MPLRFLAALFVLANVAASAAPVITSINPPLGHPWGGNFITILGDNFATRYVTCVGPCQPDGCPVQVLFDGVPGTVTNVARDFIYVIAPPHAPGKVDITVRSTVQGDAVRQDAFTYDAAAITTRSDYTRYLVPIVADDVRGALGSIWRSELTFLNASTYDVAPVADCQAPPCVPEVHPPGRTTIVDIPRNPRGDGAFFYVPSGVREDLALASRVRDVSREAEGWGTEVPVVPPEEFKDRIELVDVPIDPRYRATLRIYGTARALRARVRVFVPEEDIALSDRQIELAPASTGEGEFVPYPTYAQFDALTPEIRTAAGDAAFVRVTVDVLSVSEVDDTFNEKIWAFLSLTNNESQYITTVTPHRAR